jgi:xanthine dehydrogenase YagR molybdenum-binding subunit
MPVDGVDFRDSTELTLRVNGHEYQLQLAARVTPLDALHVERLREAYALGAERFGWNRRPREPQRDGEWLVGWGMASATMGCFRFPAAARVTLRADGTALFESSMADIGTGVFAIFSQLVGDALGVSPDRVEVRNGDALLPEACGTFGSATTMCIGAATLDACRQIRAALGEGDPLPLLRRSGRGVESALGRFSPGADVHMDADGAAAPVAMRTWGAVFVEVGVDR